MMYTNQIIMLYTLNLYSVNYISIKLEEKKVPSSSKNKKTPQNKKNLKQQNENTVHTLQIFNSAIWIH